MGQPQPSKPSGDSKKSAKTNASNLSNQVHVSNGFVVKKVRPYPGPTLSSTEGGRGPLLQLARSAAKKAASSKLARKNQSCTYASVSRNGTPMRYKPKVVPLEQVFLDPTSVAQLVKPEQHEVPPAPRLVCVETNPGPRGKAKGKKAAKAAAAGQRKAKRGASNVKHQKKVQHRMQSRLASQSQLRGSGMRNASGQGASVSMVSDGVNIGSVWKNTTSERVTFPIAREKFVDLTSTGTTLQTLVQQFVNPGNSQLFPIFSQIAKNYEQYECNHLKVMYRTEEYMASGTVVSAGLACLATNFDPDALNFGTFTEAENYEHSISGAPFSGIIEHDILGEHRRRFGKKRAMGNDMTLNNYYVNYAPNQLAPNATPAKFYDMGNFQTLVSGTQAGLIGELWIEYSFTLIRRLQHPGAISGAAAHWSSIAATTANNFAGAVLQAGNTLGGVVLTTNTITWPAGVAGTYFVQLNVAGATSASALGAASATVTGFNILSQSAVRDATNQVNSLAGTTTSPAMTSLTVTVSSSGGNFVFSPSTIVGTGTMDLFIFSLPSTILTDRDPAHAELVSFTQRVDEQDRKIAELIKLLRSRPGIDSELSDDERYVNTQSSSSSSSRASSDLSKSTLGLIGELIARKSTSTK